MTDNSLVPTNEIWYTTVNGKAIKLRAATQKKIISNTYAEGKGVIVFTEPVTGIEEGDFANCKNLQEIVIPSGATYIDSRAFKNCTGLREIFIPSTLTSIYVYAFSGCSNLTKITVEEGNPKYDSREGCNAIIAIRTNALMCGCRNTAIPSSVTAIRYGAFEGHTGLCEIVIPEGMTEIAEDAFSGCTGLEKIVFLSSETEIENGAFRGCDNLKVIYVPKGSVDHYKEQFPRYMRWLVVEEGSDLPVKDDSLGFTEITYTTTNRKPIELSSSLDEIAISNTYKDGKGVIVLDGHIDKIEDYAFEDCKNLKGIDIPNGITEIGESAFKHCKNLREIVIPEGVTKIGLCAFDGCKGLEKVVIPSSVTEIVSGAFSCCSGLCEIDVPSGIEYIDSEVFGDCTGLRKIVIPSSVTTIYDGAFLRCTGLEEVVIPESVTKIGKNAFFRCGNIKAIFVPKGKVNYYKKRVTLDLRGLIVEEGSDLPVKSEIVAKDVHFSSAVRVIVPDNETEDNILSAAKKKIENMSKYELMELILEDFDTITDSQKPYNKNEDYEEDLLDMMWDDDDDWDDEGD